MSFVLLINAFIKSTGYSVSNPIRVYTYAEFVFFYCCSGLTVAHMIDVVLYKPEGHGFDSQ